MNYYLLSLKHRYLGLEFQLRHGTSLLKKLSNIGQDPSWILAPTETEGEREMA
jgi:hypothetical protein